MMTSGNSSCGDDIEMEITRLSELSHPELVAHWKDRHGLAPPKGLSRRLLLLALSYQIQAAAQGDLDAKAIRHLRKTATTIPGAPRTPGVLKPGARIMREWNGGTHVVDVIEKGFKWNGDDYASLSAIARAITGARWSGPRFFGLRGEGS